jgi:KaiC/GvpD/RAD55 family RecA-like ATPase
MNDYLNGYEAIGNKSYEKEVERMKQYAHGLVEKNIEMEGQKRKNLNEKKEARERDQKMSEDPKADIDFSP